MTIESHRRRLNQGRIDGSDSLAMNRMRSGDADEKFVPFEIENKITSSPS